MADWLGDDPPSKWQGPHERTMYREPSHAHPPSFNPADHVPLSGRVFTPNSFTGLSDATQQRTDKLQALLSKTLGPDQVANRPGGGGTKLSYLEGWRAINLANEVFGYNGWYTDIKYLEADFIDFSPESQRWSVGVTAIVRVRLQDGASHEDVGYGKLENSKSKADALDKCKKEAVTDALKRALRHFGKLLGNCLYDKAYLEGLSKMKAPKAKFDFEGIYKPERDNVRPTPSASTSTSMAPPPAPPPRAAPVPPKKEPARGGPPRPPALPPHLAAQAQRASTIAPTSAPAPAPAPAPRAAAGPTPRRAATVATPQHVRPPAPNPYDRGGAQTEFPLDSDDESMFAAVVVDGEGEGFGGMGGAVVSEGESGTERVYHEEDSGFVEAEGLGLGDASFTSAKPPHAPHPPRHNHNAAAVPPQRPGRPSPPTTTEPGGGGPSAAVNTDMTDRVQAAKAAAQARLAEANRRKAASAQQAQQAQRRVSVGPPGAGAGAGETPAAAAGTGGSSSAADLLKLGTARPPALRPPQAPPSRSNSAGAAAGGAGGAQAKGQQQQQQQARSAGQLPSLAVGAGIARAATAAAGAGGGAGGASAGPVGQAAGGGPAALGGVSSLVGASPERTRSASSAGAVEVPSQGGFVSARGVKRGVGEG
ncbi:hypothetical protein DMC30DRAFT_276673 [Rhodotorula diobovata]|uniref:Rad52/22 family double-strand break repair protein-domain-containing protein n=1 Tax=Rhodotorula diobovata TaxID=5288 RepID=A0A5C5FUN6_9BASI|nr:hypothetical protein DMC30DRAFT_276673 [Rhodotorula diobovata]